VDGGPLGEGNANLGEEYPEGEQQVCVMILNGSEWMFRLRTVVLLREHGVCWLCSHSVNVMATSCLLKVSVEILLMIAERVEGLSDLLVLGACSRRLWDIVLRSIPGWLRLMPEAVSTEMVSKEQIMLLRNYMDGKGVPFLHGVFAEGLAVLDAEHVSVTCLVEPQGVFWWLTKESGRMPACTGGSNCSCGGRKQSVLSERNAIVAVKAVVPVGECFHTVVSVARLSPTALDVVLTCVVRDLKELYASLRQPPRQSVSMGYYQVRRYLSQLGWGMYSGGDRCFCDKEIVCSLCAWYVGDDWFFTRDVRDGGQSLLGTGFELFKTDAIGVISLCCGIEQRWLWCGSGCLS
jgi:hypothetical protein